MGLEELLVEFIAGTPVKRATWKGYWVYKYGNIQMYCADGTVVNMLDTQDVLFTLSGILAKDWEIATPQNSILGEVK